MVAVAISVTLSTTDSARRVLRQNEYLMQVQADRERASIRKRASSAYARLKHIVSSERFQSLTTQAQKQLLLQAVDASVVPEMATILVLDVMNLEIAMTGNVPFMPARSRPCFVETQSYDREDASLATGIAKAAAARVDSARLALQDANAALQEATEEAQIPHRDAAGDGRHPTS